MRLASVLVGLFAASFACAAGAACGGGAPPPGNEPRATASGTPRSVALLFEAKKSGARTFPFPFVEVTAGSVTTRFVVDTGASGHSIDRATMSTAPSVLVINGWGPVAIDRGIAIVDLPARLREHGIGGILSPQLLAESGSAVVVDLSNMQMRLLPRSTAWSQVAGFSAQLAPAGQRLCPTDAAHPAGLVLAVEGKIDGEPSKLALETGASRTLVVEGSKAGVKVSSHPVLGRSIAHSARAEVPATIHGGVPIEGAAWSLSVDVGVTPAGSPLPCGAEALLGMDVLHDCAIALTADEATVGCRYPGR